MIKNWMLWKMKRANENKNSIDYDKWRIELWLKANSLWNCVKYKKVKTYGGFIWEIYNDKK